jgi:hypothetical protein
MKLGGAYPAYQPKIRLYLDESNKTIKKLLPLNLA